MKKERKGERKSERERHLQVHKKIDWALKLSKEKRDQLKSRKVVIKTFYGAEHLIKNV